MGEHCQLCAPGYYGNATKGTPHDCLTCKCPLSIPSNNFAAGCKKMEGTDEVKCFNCREGYEGENCER